MPKKYNEDPQQALFLQLGKFSIAAGLQYIKPKIEEFLAHELQSLLQGAQMAHNGVEKPKRSLKTLQAAEASLEALTATSPKRGRPAGVKGPTDNYWSRLSPEERKAEMARRMGARSKTVKVFSPEEMIDGRYTKIGAAKVIGISPKSLDYVFKNNGGDPPSIRVQGAGRRGAALSTYAVADIEALAAARSAAK